MAGKSVLYVAPVARTFTELQDSLADIPWLESHASGAGARWWGRGLDLQVHVMDDPQRAAQETRIRYYHQVIADCRHVPGMSSSDAERQERQVFDLIDALQAPRDRAHRYPSSRVAVLVGDSEEERADRLIFALGQRHVGACLRDLSLSPRLADSAPAARARFIDQLWLHCRSQLVDRKSSRKALCCAGGGITGIFYELGVLKCLHDALANFDIRDFDMYFGISAGAIVTALIANGFSIDELIDNFSERSGPDFDVEVRLRHLTVGDLPTRAVAAAKHVKSYLGRVLERQERFNVASMASQLAALAGPFFSGHRFERHLAEILARPGHTNEFSKLKRKLYIGATDQDLREHVLFGDPGQEHVPISKAVQASSAIHPFFRSVEIDGRYYTDGFVTRTSNVIAAVEKGANLVFVIDPFLPLISETPGFNFAHSAAWVVVQDYKTVAYTRFEQVSEAFLRQNPQVTSFAFLPSNRMRRLMSSNPVSTANFDAIVTQAYRSTYRRLRQIEYKIGPQLEEHGMQLDLEPVSRTIAALDALIWPRAHVLFHG